MKVACVIPLYNNASTVLAVAGDCRRYLEQVVVVDDGSSDLPPHFDHDLQAIGGELIRHSHNRGKGAAIKSALALLNRSDTDYMITIDADGQHLPDDLPQFLDLLAKDGQDGDLIVIGARDFTGKNIPDASKFGRQFSNFWVKLETGVNCDDSQSGFRAYPVKALSRLKLRCCRYNFEIEVLVRCLWGGVRLREIPIGVIYAPPGERITHFRPFMDNLRLSLLHTALVARRLSGLPSRRLVATAPAPNAPSIWKSPRAFFLFLLHENATPGLLGLSAGLSSFLAILPLLSCHMLVILYVCIRLRLNKVMALAIQNLFMPPLTPFLCLQLGYFMRHGTFLREASMQTVVYELHLRYLDWLLGSIVLAPPIAVVVGLTVYAAASRLNRKKSRLDHAGCSEKS